MSIYSNNAGFDEVLKSIKIHLFEIKVLKSLLNEKTKIELTVLAETNIELAESLYNIKIKKQ